MTSLAKKHFDCEQIFLIFEYLEQDLKSLIEKGAVDEARALELTRQLLSALDFCHSSRVIHRDLKPQNLLLDQQGRLKLADFGLARSYSVPLPSLTQEVVTLWYRAPEIALGMKDYQPNIDVWSVGCIHAEMLAGRPLFNGSSEIEQLFKIFQLRGTPGEASWEGVGALQNFRRSFPRFKGVDLAEHFPEASQRSILLLEQCLQLDPAKRFYSHEILDGPVFSERRDDLPRAFAF